MSGDAVVVVAPADVDFSEPAHFDAVRAFALPRPHVCASAPRHVALGSVSRWAPTSVRIFNVQGQRLRRTTTGSCGSTRDHGVVYEVARSSLRPRSLDEQSAGKFRPGALERGEHDGRRTSHRSIGRSHREERRVGIAHRSAAHRRRDRASPHCRSPSCSAPARLRRARSRRSRRAESCAASRSRSRSASAGTRSKRIAISAGSARSAATRVRITLVGRGRAHVFRCARR